MTNTNDAVCCICDGPYPSPRQHLVDGIIIYQCVDQCHDEHVLATGPSNRANFLRKAIRQFKAARVTRAEGVG